MPFQGILICNDQPLKPLKVKSRKLAKLIGAQWWEAVPVKPFYTEKSYYMDLVLFIDDHGYQKQVNHKASRVYMPSPLYYTFANAFVYGDAFLSRMDDGLTEDEIADILENQDNIFI